ncbi:cyclopropane-fatty-acyl-phospholipid synthase [Ammoniphilus oxalaticus]|uniref:Cyclopropane-fatty-acyl-phospholipid synthase n=1 Tax=Ammoniphilus oxalaticus TaxID=66863 RepID=A0A419SQJ7_9BACL|nr:DUF1292 domain-containing protein [Ammoniphilus oxalaticus]RKD26750.1 cyclopropane-fatty-acyl-phospholipid synthase [Ammoniphilus oxalaticus]
MDNQIELGEIFTLVDENDEEQEVEVLGKLEIDEDTYIAVSFVQEIEENEDEEIDVFFLRVDPNGELDAIESDEEFEKVANAFEEAMHDEHGCDDPTHNHG